MAADRPAAPATGHSESEVSRKVRPMNDLRRELAPITSEAWEAIDDEAKKALKLILAARRIVDFTGPLGWSVSAVSLGRTGALSDSPNEGVEAGLREVQPLVEFRTPFELSRTELDSITRGAKDPDLNPVRL